MNRQSCFRRKSQCSSGRSSRIAVAALRVLGARTAQESATLVMRSGERVSGQLVDLGGVGFTSGSTGRSAEIPTNDVAVIDFTGGNMSDADWAKLNAGEHAHLAAERPDDRRAAVLTSAAPPRCRFTFKTACGDREFSSSEIGRIVLARPQHRCGRADDRRHQVPEGQGIVVSGAAAVDADRASPFARAR